VKKKTLTLFVEGGGRGTSGTTHAAAREGFTKFLQSCLPAVRPSLRMCGPRDVAYNLYKAAKARGENCILLVDAEDALNKAITDPWQQPRLKERDTAWRKPTGDTGNDLHFMAPTMEAWLVANPEVLKEYFGQGFKIAKLPKASDLETVSKKDIYKAIEDATRASNHGEYGKGPDSFALLGRMEPAAILKRCPYWAKRFCDELKRRGLS
jgi:hypothetical protein